MARPRCHRVTLLALLCVLNATTAVRAQNRGVYPLGMSATNSGVTPLPGFTYSNQLLFYSRDEAKSNDGSTLSVAGNNALLMDMNTLIWVSRKEILGGAHYSAFVTLPFAKNDLTSDVNGKISGGGGFADSYYVPFVLGWNKERVALRILYGFLAPTGRFVADGGDNVGSGYWTNAFSSGQTFYLTDDRAWAVSAYEMYELHTTQEGTGTRPGDTFDLDYSATRTFTLTKATALQVGVGGYNARQTTAKTGPEITADQSEERYAVNALGFVTNLTLANRRVNAGVKFFEEFANRATFQGFSLQLSGSVHL